MVNFYEIGISNNLKKLVVCNKGKCDMANFVYVDYEYILDTNDCNPVFNNYFARKPFEDIFSKFIDFGNLSNIVLDSGKKIDHFCFIESTPLFGSTFDLNYDVDSNFDDKYLPFYLKSKNLVYYSLLHRDDSDSSGNDKIILMINHRDVNLFLNHSYKHNPTYDIYYWCSHKPTIELGNIEYKLIEFDKILTSLPTVS